MAGPSPKRIKSGLPLCTIHRPGNRLVKQNFPVALEEALCGVTSALLEVSYVFQLLGENFDLSDMSLPNVAKFFWEQAKEERKEAETLIQYQHDRGGLYCTKLIQSFLHQAQGDYLVLPLILSSQQVCLRPKWHTNAAKHHKDSSF